MKLHNPKNILVVRLDRIGDVILSTPAIRSIKETFPASRITVMVRPHARDIVVGSPFIDGVILYDKDKSQRGIWQMAKLIMDLRRRRFDAAIILHPTARSHLLACLAGIPVRIGYDKKLGGLLTFALPHEKQRGAKHEREYVLDLVRLIGCETRDTSLFMPKDAGAEERVRALLADAGISEQDPLVVIHPSASCPSKRWPAERFARVADTLIEASGVRVIIVSGEGHRESGDAVQRAMKMKVLNLSGKTTIGELASIMRRSKMLISCDSGPVHIAAAVGTPVVVIFGRSDKGLSPARWGPTGERDIVLHKYVGCAVCLAHNCDKGFKCLMAVSVDEVIAAAHRLLV